MKRKLLLVLAFIALPGFANALGLGKLQLNSALNQPFDARIELLAAGADELDSLNVGLADSEAFRRAKIDRPFILGLLKFEVIENESGPDYIQISSRDAIREPFLNFLLEANWSSGRLYREYTVLLDPPLYDPNAGRSASRDSYSPSSSSSDSYISDDEDTDSSRTVVSGPSYSGNEYGPTASSDTLWSIATQVRPDRSVSIQQMMLALLRSNPEAFINGNINGLKRGQILNIPGRDEIEALSPRQAIAEVGAQNSNWQGSGGPISETVSERAESMDVDDDMASSDMDDAGPAMIEDDQSELKLVAASSDGAGVGQGGGDGSSGSNVDLALANEQLQAVTQENADLKDRMQEAETIIGDLKRLIALKDDELARLQQQMAGGGPGEQPDTGMESDADTGMEDDAGFGMEDDAGFGMEDDADTGMEDEAEVGMEDDLDTEMEADTEAGMEDDADTVMEDDAEAEMDEDADAGMVDEAETATDASMVETTAAPTGLVDQVLGFIMGNLVIIAGALAGLIIVIVLLLFISRRKQNADSELAPVSTTDFPDFDDAETEAGSLEATAESVEDMDIDASEEETVLPVGDEEAAAETEFVAPPEPQETAAPEPAPAPEEPEEDPLAEVNVLIAYEQFEQAEEFVRDAIAQSPDRADFHAKLLEVFYAANDKKSYEEAAQVLHEKVNGEGPHWEMTLAMWQEMSPNRALFEEGGDEPEAAPAEGGGGGIMDITAEDDEQGGEGASLDFDLGMDAGEEPVAAEHAANEEEDVLDITSADSEDVSVLDVTSAAHVDASTTDEDLLDVTAAVGLDTDEFADEVAAATADDEEPMLDITSSEAASPAATEDEDVLDISHGGGEDLLDVTANANLEPEGLEEDLLDVTSSVAAEADGEELQEIQAEEATGDDNSIDFDIGGMDIEPASDDSDAAAESAEENLIDFDMGSADEEAGLELDTGTEADDGSIDLELDVDSSSENDDDAGLEFDTGAAEEDGGVELDLSIDDDAESATAGETSIDEIEESSDDGLEIDLSLDDEPAADDSLELEVDGATGDDLEIDLSLDEDDGDDSDKAAESTDVELDMDFDLEIQDDSDDEPEIDMDGTVEMPKLDIDELGGIEIDDDDDDDDDDDHTVFVPRAGAADEQTAEDEIATKLDLAKAYVELGDKDSAKGILDEVLADGNDEQKQTAQDLLKQLD